jgi:hypothetical protein
VVAFDADHPAHLPRTLFATSAETLVLSAALIALSLRVARART